MEDWIPVSEGLPKDRQRVHIVVLELSYGKTVRVIHTAIFYKGKTPKKGDLISWEDQHGNNRRPYGWACPPRYWFGQEVTHWIPIVPPK